MLTPPKASFYLNQIYISAPRSLHTVKTTAKLDTKAEGITVSMMHSKNMDGVRTHYLRVEVNEEAKPGTYYATVTGTSKGTNNKTLTKTTRVAIIVQIRTKEETKVSLNDEPKPIKVNCVGDSCPSEPTNANCLGINCATTTILNCSGGLCPQSIEILCPSGNCPSSLDLNCDEINCDLNGMTFSVVRVVVPRNRVVIL